MATAQGLHYMSDTTHVRTQIEEAGNSSDPVKKSYTELDQGERFSLGESTSTTPDRSVSPARSSATKKGESSPRLLSCKLIESLITAGLVSGITPTSIRRELGAVIPDFVSLWRDGDDFRH